MDVTSDQSASPFDEADLTAASEESHDVEFALVDGHDGSQHHFLARNEVQLRAGVAASTGVDTHAQILLVRPRTPSDGVAGCLRPAVWLAFSADVVFTAKTACQFDAVCFDRGKVGSSAPIALPPLEPADVMLPEQQPVFHGDDPDVEAAAIDAAPRILHRSRHAYFQQLLELRLFLANLHAAAGCIVEGGEERLQSIRLAQSQAGRLQLAFDAATSQTLERCRQLSAEAAAAAAAGEAADIAASAVAAEVPTWLALLSSIRISDDDAKALVGSDASATSAKEPSAAPLSAAAPTGTSAPAVAAVAAALPRKSLADVLPAGHADRLLALLPTSQASAASAAAEIRTSVLPALQQQLHVFSAVVEQADAHAAGRRDAFAALLTRAAADVASQRRARALVDGAFHAVVGAANTLFHEVLRLADAGSMPSTPVPASPASASASASAASDASPEVAAAWALLSQPPYADGAIDAAASTLASADGHLASLQRQAHGLLCEAAQAVNGHLGRVAALQGAAQAASESTADAVAANQALAAVCGELQHLQLLPGSYGALVAERRRRAAFESTLRWAAAAMERSLQRMCDSETAARQAFASRHAQHLPRRLLAASAVLYPAPPTAVALCTTTDQAQAGSADEATKAVPTAAGPAAAATTVTTAPGAAATAAAAAALWRPLFPAPHLDGPRLDGDAEPGTGAEPQQRANTYYGPAKPSLDSVAAVPSLRSAVRSVGAAEAVCAAVASGGGDTSQLMEAIAGTAAAAASAAVVSTLAAAPAATHVASAAVPAADIGHKHAASQGHLRRRFSEPASAVGGNAASATTAAAGAAAPPAVGHAASSADGAAAASLATSLATVSSGSGSSGGSSSGSTGSSLASSPAAPPGSGPAPAPATVTTLPKRSKSVGAAVESERAVAAATTATGVGPGVQSTVTPAPGKHHAEWAAGAAPSVDSTDTAALASLARSALVQRLAATEAELSSLLAVASLPGWVAARYVRLADVAAAVAAGRSPSVLALPQDEAGFEFAAASVDTGSAGGIGIGDKTSKMSSAVDSREGASGSADTLLHRQLAPIVSLLELVQAGLQQQPSPSSYVAAAGDARIAQSEVATLPYVLAPGLLSLRDIVATVKSESSHSDAVSAASAAAAPVPQTGHDAVAAITPLPATASGANSVSAPRSSVEMWLQAQRRARVSEEPHSEAEGAGETGSLLHVPPQAIPRSLPDRLTSQLIALLTAADALMQRATACTASHIAYRAFRVGDSALFFPQGRRADSSGRPLYLAFNDGSAPHCYLDHDGSTSTSTSTGTGAAAGAGSAALMSVVPAIGSGSTPSASSAGAALSSSPGAAKAAAAGAAAAAPFSLLPAPPATALAGAFPLSVHRRESSAASGSGGSLSGRAALSGAAAALAGPVGAAGNAPSSPSLGASPSPLAVPAPVSSGSPGLGGLTLAHPSARLSSTGSGGGSGSTTPQLAPIGAPMLGLHGLLAAPSPIALTPAAAGAGGTSRQVHGAAAAGAASSGTAATTPTPLPTPASATSAGISIGIGAAGGRWPDFVIGRITSIRTLGPLSAGDVAGLKAAAIAAASGAAASARANSSAAGSAVASVGTAGAVSPTPSAQPSAVAVALQSPFAQLLLTLPAGTSVHLLSVQRLSR